MQRTLRIYASELVLATSCAPGLGVHNHILCVLCIYTCVNSLQRHHIIIITCTSISIYGLFQCRGDLAVADCSHCVAHAVSQLGTICPGSTGGALELDGCFVKYDDSEFLGVEDKTLVVKKCGSSTAFTSDGLTRRDAVLSYLETSDGVYKLFRTTSLGDLQGTAQCVGDLSATDCQDCLSHAIGRLREECGPAHWGRVGLAKCYACYSEGGDYSPDENGKRKSKNGDGLQKMQTIIVGVVAVVALLTTFISLLTKPSQSKIVVNPEELVDNKPPPTTLPVPPAYCICEMAKQC